MKSNDFFYCIAGKNQIAIDGVNILLKYGILKTRIIALINKTDDGVNSWQPSFKYYCQRKEIPIAKLSDLYNIENLVFISLEFDQLIHTSNFKTKWLFNIHFSKLPAYKGMYTSILPILHGDRESGVTLHFIDDGIDTGEIIDQLVFDLPSYCTGLRLYYLYLEHGRMLLERNIKNLISCEIKSVKQSRSNSTYFAKSTIKFNDLEINFKQTAFQVTNYINAFAFRPYQLLKYKDFRIAKSFITEKSSTLKPGTILDETESFFLLSTIDYDVCILKDRLESILVSAEQNDFKRLDDYLNCGYDLTEKNMFGWDPLIVASYYGSFDTINYILQNQLINVNTKNNNGTTALMYAMTYAVKTNDLIAMKLLIDIGAPKCG